VTTRPPRDWQRASLDALAPEDILDLAGVPTTCPHVLEPRHVEAVFGLTRGRRLQLAAVGILEPLPRRAYQHDRYRHLDVARAILLHGLTPYWHRLDV
jgi:hypothetical protein